MEAAKAVWRDWPQCQPAPLQRSMREPLRCSAPVAAPQWRSTHAEHWAMQIEAEHDDTDGRQGLAPADAGQRNGLGRLWKKTCSERLEEVG